MSLDQQEKTATFIKQKNGTGDGRIYRLDPRIYTPRHHKVAGLRGAVSLVNPEPSLSDLGGYSGAAISPVAGWVGSAVTHPLPDPEWLFQTHQGVS